MALDVEGSFLITIGHGAGPEMVVALSVAKDDGSPVFLDFDQEPVELSVVLSAMFGNFNIPLSIFDSTPLDDGFYGLRVKGPGDLGVELYKIVPSTLGITVKTGSDRGQALACSCGGAHVTSWFAEQTQDPPKLRDG